MSNMEEDHTDAHARAAQSKVVAQTEDLIFWQDGRWGNKRVA